MRKPITFVRRWLWLVALVVAAAGGVHAAEVIPSVPTRYFNDYALTVKPETANRLNGELEDLEKTTSNQVLVVIYPTMQTDSAVDDYCLRIFRAWKVGQKGQDNGAVLFVFLQNHKLWIQTGRGLEGALPDATCKDITADRIAPLFKKGDYDGGVTAGVEAMIAATKGEYKGTGQTDYQKQHPDGGSTGNGGFPWGTLIFFILMAFFISRVFRPRGGMMFGGGGPTFIGGGFGSGLGGGFGGGFGGGGGSSGGDSGGGGGSFSSGGGDSGGGGAGSDW